jgi:Ca2+-binding RTX toxin-like protein
MAKSSGKYVINGTAGDDPLIDGSTYPDDLQLRGLYIDGKAGDDIIRGGWGKDILLGGDGSDRIYASLTDLLGVGDGKIVWDGGRGDDTLDLSDMVSEPGKGVWLELGFGARSTSFLRTNVDKHDYSMIWGATFDATYKNNFVGFENVLGSSGDDIINFSNGAGSNILKGGAGNDYLSTADGNDTVHGEAGDDMIAGGWGNDTLSGGDGSDTFLITGRLAGQYTFDTIMDFDWDASDGTRDQIWLWEGWSIRWDEETSTSTTLHGYLLDNGTVFGELTLLGLSYAHASKVEWHNVDPATGMPGA